VDRMASALQARGFGVNKCCGEDATRAGIRTAWQGLINQISREDAVVIFYSGHGGLVEAPREPGTESKPNQHHLARRQYQFLLPTDFEETSDGDFRGILDVEISLLLRDTTNKTSNVTVILDCCHSGRMARDAIHGHKAIAKQLPKVYHYDIDAWVKVLKGNGCLDGDLAVDANTDAVRIFACAARETAWEYLKDGQWGGVFTEALTSALREANGQEISWNTLLLRVNDLVQAEFPQQNPRAEGPDTRGCFSTTPVPSQAFLVNMEGGIPVLHAGRVVGVREGNQYAVMPFGVRGINTQSQIAVATVTRVVGFKSRVELDFGSAGGSLPANGAQGFLTKEALHEWPVLLPNEIPGLRQRVDASVFLRHRSGRQDAPHLAEFRFEGGKVTVNTEKGVQIAAQEIADAENAPPALFDRVIYAAEVLAKAQHFLRLKCENEQESLIHELKVEVGTVLKDGSTSLILRDGRGFITAGDRVYISLHNAGQSTIYVSVFDVNVAGRIRLLSTSNASGLELRPGHSYTLGQTLLNLLGMEVSWPAHVPSTSPVGEHFSFVVSSKEVNIRHVETSEVGTTRLAKIGSQRLGPPLSNLEEITYRLASGQGFVSGERRDTGDEGGDYPRYDIFAIPFTIFPAVTAGPVIPAEQLPAPESTAEWSELPTYPPHVAQKVSSCVRLRVWCAG
jgi:hypothetical protein